MGAALAQPYPSRPITMIVPFGAGGPTDALARILAQRMSLTLGQQVVIENVTGGSGTIAIGRVARAAPDGYTLVIGNWASHVVNSAIFKTAFDYVNDFEPVARLSGNPYIIVGKNALPPTLRELIAWLKANPDKATEGTGGAGSGQHVGGVYFQKVTGTRFQFVPYRAGSSDVMRDVVAGHIDLSIDQAISALPYIRQGQLRAYAVADSKRLAAAPGHPDRGRGRRAGRLRDRVVRHLDAEGHAERRDRQIQRGRHGGAGGSGRAREARGPRPGHSAARAADLRGARRASTRPRSTNGGRSSRKPASRSSSRAVNGPHHPQCAAVRSRGGAARHRHRERPHRGDRAAARGGRAGARRAGCLCCPGLIETHIHLDKSRIIERCAPQPRATLSPVKGVTPLKKDMTVEDVRARAARTIEQCILHGATRMRTQVEVDPGIGMRGYDAV